MASHDLHLTHNIGIMVHIDAGRTVTPKRILFYTGKTHKIGEVRGGAVTTDWMAQEQERGVTITSAATICSWNYLGKFYKVNLIDTPGHVDFTTEVERSLRVLDGAVATYSAADDVQSQPETIWRWANKYNVPRIGYVDKVGRSGADFYKMVQQMKDILDASPIATQTPIGAEENSRGVVGLIKMKATLWHDETIGAQHGVEEIPADLADGAAEWCEKLLEGAANYGGELMEMYPEGRDTPEDKLIAAIRKGCIVMECCPMLLGFPHKNKGVQLLLDYACAFLPSPLDTPATAGINPGTEEEEDRKPSKSEPTSALASKIATDPFMDCLISFRVYSGKAVVGSYVLSICSGKRECISRLFQMNSNKGIPMESIDAGDVGAGIGFKDIRTDNTLCDENTLIILESITFPDTVIFIAIEPRSQTNVARPGNGLSKLAEEDPTFTARTDEQSGQTIIFGIGELHFNTTIDRLKREFKVECNQGKSQANYKEAITKVVQSRETYKKQSGDRGKLTCIDATIEPKDEDYEEGDLQFVNAIKGGNVLKEFTSAAEKGFRDCPGNGVLDDFPVTGLKVTLTDGSSHPVDSGQLSFEFVAHQASKALCPKAGLALMESIMKVEVVTPEENMGDVIGDLNRCRGLVQGMDEARSGAHIVKAMVSLSEMLGYVTALRTITSDCATSSMEYDHRSLVSGTLAKETLGELKGNSDLIK